MQAVFLNIIAPIVVLIALGALMRRKFNVDLASLSKLNVYLFVPAFIFYAVATTTLDWSKMLGVVVVCVAQVLTFWLIVEAIGRLLRVSRATLSAITLVTVFYNCGNYGLPLSILAYPDQADAAAVQSFVILTQNLLIFTLGLMIAASAHATDLRKSFSAALRLPILPALAVALILRWWTGGDAALIPALVRLPAKYLADGLVPIALITLGAQLAVNPRWPRWKPVSLVLFLRLIIGPIHIAALLWILQRTNWAPVRLWPWPAELLILTSGTPSAVTALLLALELGGDTDLAADCIFWTTLLSCFTIGAWLLVLGAA